MPSFDEDGSSSKDPGGTGSTGPFAIADVTGLQAELDNKISGSTINAKGDLLLGTANDTVGRLAVGTNGQVLTADSTESTGAKWVTPSATDSSKIPLSTVDAKGDLLVGTANDTVARQAVGSNNTLLVANSAQTNGVEWRALAASDIPALAYKGISCGKTSDQSVSGDTATDITFTTEIIAETSDLSHSTSSNPAEVTCNTTQNYRIRATIVFAANGTGSYFTEYVSVLVGGTEKHRVPLLGSKPGVTQPHHFSVDIDLPVTAAQVVKLQMYSGVNGGSVLGQIGGVNQTILSITPLGA